MQGNVSNAPIGWLDAPESEGLIGPVFQVRGWALARAGIRAVEIRIGERAWCATLACPRPDVAEVYPAYPDNPNSGFECAVDVADHPAPAGVERRPVSIVAIAADGTQTLLAERTLIEPHVHTRWTFASRDDRTPFFLAPALSGIANGGSFGIDTRYAAYASPSTRIGMRVPILYLRTTTGADDDYHFDPAFDTRRRHGDRPVADDALTLVLEDAAARAIPLLVTLNGGIWADAAGSAPRYDLCDYLEEDAANCQWNAQNEVLPDDYLQHLPGSHASPELARALTLNVYAARVRRYKRRNLQEAARLIARFMHEHPTLLIGVNLDPDVYINPFFEERQWYDYNPGTLRQFRHWLAGSGPYAGIREHEVPDLTRYRRPDALSLQDVERLARRSFQSFDDVDPPRVFSRDPEKPFWRDPWVHAWETFRRHLVALHYEELAQWLIEVGIPGDRIWSSQGFMAPAADCMPLALRIDSPVKNYDSGGVSIEGGKPPHAHLGAIVYGDAACNSIAMEEGGTLFDALAAIDPDFALVEFNTADLRRPAAQPTYGDAYRAFRDAWNAGARIISPMAWNGSNGVHAAEPGYVSYTAWRNTPLESAARDFLLARSGLPRGARLWTFGTQQHIDDDGWRAARGSMRAFAGGVELSCDARRVCTLLSPLALGLESARIGMVVLGVATDALIERVAISARLAGQADFQALAVSGFADLETTEAGALVRCRTPEARRVDQIRIEFTLAAAEPFRLARVAILEPASAERRSA